MPLEKNNRHAIRYAFKRFKRAKWISREMRMSRLEINIAVNARPYHHHAVK